MLKRLVSQPLLITMMFNECSWRRCIRLAGASRATLSRFCTWIIFAGTLSNPDFNYRIFLLSFADIPDIPDDIRHLRLLQVADFSSNPIPKLPAGFSQLKSLTILGLNDMSLTSLPADFGWWVFVCWCRILIEWLAGMIYAANRNPFPLAASDSYSTSWCCVIRHEMCLGRVCDLCQKRRQENGAKSGAITRLYIDWLIFAVVGSFS